MPLPGAELDTRNKQKPGLVLNVVRLAAFIAGLTALVLTAVKSALQNTGYPQHITNVMDIVASWTTLV